jgi:murein DD-endopeptidase MepM/ murein hydrolase activator NlpD
MKHAIGFLAAFALAAQTPSPIEGNWEGVLGGALHLTLEMTRTRDGVLLGKVTSVDQGAVIPIDRTEVKGDAVRLELNTVGGVYEGSMNPAHDAIEGTWSQRGTTQPLKFTRAAAAPAPAKPGAPPPSPREYFEAFGVPADVSIPVVPQPFTDPAGKTHLVYELHITNSSPFELHLERVEVMSGASVLHSLEAAPLIAAAQRVGGPSQDARTIAAGGSAVVFLWVTPGAAPQSIHHRLTFDGRALDCANVSIPSAKPILISPPLRGANWLAANGPSNTSGHRRALIPINGRTYIAQRFAIDWVQRGDDGKTFSGDAKNNKNYHAYGSDALAVADATVVTVKDGIPENIPGGRAVPITLETVGGNHMILDLGGGRFAFYAHLQPGSIRVKLGDRVRRGQVLGLVGNSGNSTEPHLHFHVSDANSPLGSEGLPYAIDKFDVIDGKSAVAHENAMPLQDMRIRFSSGGR